VAWELDRLRAVGIDRAIVVDLTKDTFKIPVVRVIVPGMEHSIDSGRPGPRGKTLLKEFNRRSVV